MSARTDVIEKWTRHGFFLGFALGALLTVWWVFTAVTSSTAEGLAGISLVAIVAGLPVSLVAVAGLEALPLPDLTGLVLIIVCVLVNWTLAGWIAGLVLARSKGRK